METRDEFTAEVAKPDDQIDLGRAALLIARDAHPDVDVDAYLRRLDEIAARVRPRLSGFSASRDRIAALSEFLHTTEGFRGNRDEYYDPRNSYLSDVLDRRLGIPISLSILYIEIGRRAEVPLVGIGLPGHFLVGHRDADGEVFLDPFSDGRFVDEAECRALVAEVHGDSMLFRREMLEPVSKRQILFRMLNNLKLVHMARQEPESALRVIDRMLAIAPDSWVDVRDRGLLRYGLGRYEEARADLRQYLRESPRSPDRAAVEDALAAIETILAMYR